MREMILAHGWPFINILPNCVNGSGMKKVMTEKDQ